MVRILDEQRHIAQYGSSERARIGAARTVLAGHRLVVDAVLKTTELSLVPKADKMAGWDSQADDLFGSLPEHGGNGSNGNGNGHAHV